MKKLSEQLAGFRSSIVWIAFAILMGFRNSYQFRELKARLKDMDLKADRASRYWHGFQAVIQLIILGTIYLETQSILLVVSSAGFFWLMFDGLVNTIGLKRNFFYVGETAFIDRLFQKTGKPSLFMGLAKTLLFTVPLFFYLMQRLTWL